MKSLLALAFAFSFAQPVLATQSAESTTCTLKGTYHEYERNSFTTTFELALPTKEKPTPSFTTADGLFTVSIIPWHGTSNYTVSVTPASNIDALRMSAKYSSSEELKSVELSSQAPGGWYLDLKCEQ